MGNVFGTSGAAPAGNNHFVATGSGVYTNDKGETIHESFRHVNGEFTRQTSTGTVPLPNGFLAHPQEPGHVAMMAPVAATVMLVIIVAIIIYSRQTKRPVKRTIAVIDDTEAATNSIPLYSLRPHHPSNAMWNIDLLDE